MEEPEFEALKPPEALFSFFPRPRSHLRSATYCALTRIFSHCYNDSELSRAIVPEKIYENSIVQRDKMDDKSFGDEGIPQIEFCKIPEVVHELVQTMMMETDENVIVDKSSVGSGLRDKYINEEMVMHELEDIIKGDEIHSRDYMKTSSLNQIHFGSSNVVCLVQELQVCQQVVEESRNTGQSVCKNIFSLDENATEKMKKSKEESQDTRISTEGNSMSKFPEMKPTEMGFGTFVCSKENPKEIQADTFKVTQVEEEGKHREDVTNASVLLLDENLSSRIMDKCENDFCKETLISPHDEVESGDAEEGEICGDWGIEDRLGETLSEDFEELQKNEDEMERAANALDGNKVLPNHTIDESDSNGSRLKDGQRDKNTAAFQPGNVVQGKLMICKKGQENDLGQEERRNRQKDCRATVGVDSAAACPSNLVFQAQISMKNTTDSTSTQKQDRDVCNQKKRGIPSKESKEKRKEKKRKRRAEKNRELGVKRLKLHPVIKQKPLAHCRHYLRGRCQEGEKCKFSHDTVPLTKSKPCCHFARHSCMKGDDCPFDHQLSKYPCSNFALNGSCSRGSACMFSHKMPLEEVSKSTSNLVAELKSPSLLGISETKKQIDTADISKPNPDALSKTYINHSCKDTIQSGALTSLEKTPQAPIGINFLSFGKSPSLHSSNVKHGSSSPKRNETGQYELGIFKTPLRASTELVPKGMSFFSFNKAPMEDSNISKLSTLSSYSSCGGKLIEQSVEEPKRMNLVSFYRDNRLVGSSSNLKYGIESTLDVNSSPAKHHNWSSSSSRLLHTPLSSGQPLSDSFTSRIYKGTTNSAQKALLSTFAFAAKYESLMKVNQPIDSSTINSAVNQEQ